MCTAVLFSVCQTLCVYAGAISLPELSPVFILPWTDSTSSQLISALSKRLNIEKILKAHIAISNTSCASQNATQNSPLRIKTMGFPSKLLLFYHNPL